MYPVCLFVFATFLQTTVATVTEPLDRPTFGVVRPVALYDASVVVMRNKEPVWCPPRRELTASGTSSCRWNNIIRACNVNPIVAMLIFRSSESGIADILFRTSRCEAKGTNITKCFALEGCAWNGPFERCDFVDILAVCIGYAHRVVRRNHVQNSTAAHGTTKTTFALLISFTFYLGKLNLKQPLKEIELRSIQSKRQQVSAKSFIPSSLSSRNLIGIPFSLSTCQRPIAQMAMINWSVAESDFQHFADSCSSSRYQNASQEACNADPLCDYTELQGCIQHRKVTLRAFSKADKVLLALVPDRADKAIAGEALRCGRFANASECTKNCRWTGNACAASTTFLDREILRNTDKNSTDAMCVVYRMRLDSGCTKIRNSLTCLATADCGWDMISRECNIGNHKFRERLIQEDPDLEKPLNKAAAKCEPRKNAKACSNA